MRTCSRLATSAPSSGDSPSNASAVGYRAASAATRCEPQTWTTSPTNPWGSVIVWAGMRGAITLAAAQTISSHAPLRGYLLTIALFIAAGSLIIQGLTLPGVIRVAKPQMASGDIPEEERAKLLKVMGSALVDTALAQAIHEVDGQTLLSAGVSRTLSRIGHAVSHEGSSDGDRIARTADRVLSDILQDAGAQEGATHEGMRPRCDDETDETAGETRETGEQHGDHARGTVDMSGEDVERSFTREQIRELALEAIHAQREALLGARDAGIFSSAALEDALARLDYEEILLVSGHGQEH